LSFARHLPAAGWVPIVVTARESALSDRDPNTLAEIPPGTRLLRAPGIDLSRKLSFRGAYARWLATPDRWNTWAFGAALAGLRAARECRADALWFTFPVPSAALAGLLVQRWTGLPLVADLRDPMVYEGWPETRWDRAVYGWLERWLVHRAAAVVLTTPSATAYYRRRYPNVPPERFREIPNGINELDIPSQDQHAVDRGGPLTLVHSGLIEIPDRDPTALFQALRLLLDRGQLPPRGLRVTLRASGRETMFRAAAERIGVEHIVALAPRMSHVQAVAEMHTASGLLLLQGSPCNRQIPAKAYEYLASRRPIVALMDPAGDTHGLVAHQWGVPYCAGLDDAEAIAAALVRFFSDVAADRAYVPPAKLVTGCRRSEQAAVLGRLLDELVVQHAAAQVAVPAVAETPADRGA
jgi:hypothetical protein